MTRFQNLVDKLREPQPTDPLHIAAPVKDGHGYAAAQIHDWEIKQRLADVEAALAEKGDSK